MTGLRILLLTPAIASSKALRSKYGYNRIHMTNHFLTDVCFGTLITYCIYAGISTAFLRATEK